MIIHEVTDPAHWNATLTTLPYHHVLQSWEWGAFKERYGWTARRLAFEDGGRTVALASILRRRLAPLPLAMVYVPKGPVLAYENDGLRAAVWSTLEGLARRERAVFLKLDPDVPVGLGLPGTTEDQPDPLGQAVVAELQERGWRYSLDQVQFKNTITIDLTRSDDELLAAMKSKTRYNIRLAERKGVRVRAGGPDDLELLYHMYTETAQRDAFLIRPLEYYRDAWGTFIRAGLACPLIAEVAEDDAKPDQREPVAAVILFRLGYKTLYMYGASRAVHRDKMPNHLLQWEAMRWARAQGSTVYDFWGAPDVFDESDRMWGVYRFKEGFGGQIVRHIGAYDYAPWPLLYTLYGQLRRRQLAVRDRLMSGVEG
jgi:lipid II:glycine glycyltransferase (peptidoglycan interpeptide bridge formation enzyme)